MGAWGFSVALIHSLPKILGLLFSPLHWVLQSPHPGPAEGDILLSQVRLTFPHIVSFACTVSCFASAAENARAMPLTSLYYALCLPAKHAGHGIASRQHTFRTWKRFLIGSPSSRSRENSHFGPILLEYREPIRNKLGKYFSFSSLLIKNLRNVP